MRWTDDIDARKRQRAADKAGPAAASQTKPPPPPNTLLTLLVAGAVLVPLMHSLGWLQKAKAALEARGVRLPWRRGGRSGGRSASSAGSAFRFPKAQQPPSTSPAKRAVNAKKDKAGRADKRDARAQKRSEAYLQAERGPKTGKPAGIPKDKDVLGGSEGTVFHTASHFTTSTAQLRAGQEAASSKSLLR